MQAHPGYERWLGDAQVTIIEIDPDLQRAATHRLDTLDINPNPGTG